MKTVATVIEELHKKYFEEWYDDTYFDAFLEDYGFDESLHFGEPSFAFIWSTNVDGDSDSNELDAFQFFVGPLEFTDIRNDIGITQGESEELFKVWIQNHFIAHGKLDTSMFDKIYSTWIPMLIEVDYFKIYSSEELVEIFELTGNEKLLSKNIQDVFLF